MEANQTASGRGSRATGAPQAATREKAFACTHPGCTKRFTRAEHLQRHALNHVPGGGAACPLCQAHFKRPDLLSEFPVLPYVSYCIFNMMYFAIVCIHVHVFEVCF